MIHLALLVGALAQAAEPAADPRPPATELVALLKDTPVAELQKRSFVELNVLKNTVFAASGYRFAEDRPWLRLAFCTPETALLVARDDPALRLSRYRFPACQEGGALNEAQRKALANLRVATFKRIAGFATASALDRAVSEDFRGLGALRYALLDGRKIPADVAVAWERSLKRDMAGYQRLRQLADRPGGFDAMELLGLYAGDVLFLRAMIEARHGKPLTGTLAWEVQQLLGVIEARSDYDPARLPIEVQTTLQILDDVIQKIQRSEINDLPARLKGKRLDYKTPPAEEEETTYQGAAC